jgi:hypothetical protein
MGNCHSPSGGSPIVRAAARRAQRATAACGRWRCDRSRRREFIAMFAGAAGTWPRDTLAQQSAIPVIGFLSSASPKPYAGRVAAFRKGLNEAGYIEGRDVAIEFRWAQGQYDRLPVFAADLVSQRAAVIVSSGGDVVRHRQRPAPETVAAGRSYQRPLRALRDWLWAVSARRARVQGPRCLSPGAGEVGILSASGALGQDKMRMCDAGHIPVTSPCTIQPTATF